MKGPVDDNRLHVPCSEIEEEYSKEPFEDLREERTMGVEPPVHPQKIRKKEEGIDPDL